MTKNKEPLESAITTKILEALRKDGGFWFKTHGNMYQMSGLPDILGCYKGRFVGFEVKRPSRKENGVSKIQLYVLGKIEKAGGLTGVVASVDDALTILHKNL